MRTHVALLRGINVGGRNRMAMADLREIAMSLGFGDVSTYIQSGNVALTSAVTDTAGLAATLEREIAARSDVRPAVVVLSRAELAKVVADNPFPDETNPKCLHVVFYRGGVGPHAVAAVAAAEQRARDKGSRDEATVVARNLYLRTPDGLGRSELAAHLSRSRAGTTSEDAGTMRNWATVIKLMALLDH